MSNHALGPWSYDKKTEKISADKIPIATVDGWEYLTQGNIIQPADADDILAANGRLIAAAPEMYALISMMFTNDHSRRHYILRRMENLLKRLNEE